MPTFRRLVIDERGLFAERNDCSLVRIRGSLLLSVVVHSHASSVLLLGAHWAHGGAAEPEVYAWRSLDGVKHLHEHASETITEHAGRVSVLFPKSWLKGCESPKASFWSSISVGGPDVQTMTIHPRYRRGPKWKTRVSC